MGLAGKRKWKWPQVSAASAVSLGSALIDAGGGADLRFISVAGARIGDFFVDGGKFAFNEVASNVGVVRGKVEKVGPNVAQHLAAHMQPTYALLRDIAPLVGVQIGPEHEMASLEELPVFSPAGGAIVSPPSKGELAPARKPPGLKPKDLSGAMEVEKEGAEAAEEGVVSEKENGSNTADGGLVKDKKKKK